MLINNAVITGSFIVNGVDVVGITGSSAISSSFLALSSSYVITSASYAQSSASLSIRTSNLEATSSTLVSASSSFAAQSASFSSRVNIIEGQDATTGSNVFTGTQYVSEASNAISFTSTASLYTDGGLRVAKDSFVSGTAYFNNITVYGTSSIEYITSSQVNIGSNIITVNTDTPAVRFGGLSVFDSGSTQLTGSLFWDSEKNHWIYSNPSGSSYNSGMIMSGPRNSGSLGDEQGTTLNALMKGQGGDHITSSQMFDDGTTVRIPGNLQVTGSTILPGALTGSSATFSDIVNLASTANQTKLSWLGYNSAYTKISSDVGFDATYNGTYITNNTNAAGNAQGNTAIPSWALELGGSDSFKIKRSSAGSFSFSTLFNIASTGAATFSSTVTATGFEVGNGQFYKARRTSSNLLTDMIGIPTGTDDVRILTTGAFNVINGALNTMFGIASNGAATFISSIEAVRLYSGGAGLLVSSYGSLSQTVSGQMTILGHNVIADQSATNTVTVLNGGWYSSMIKMYYSEGITFHTSPTVYSANATYPMAETERIRIASNGNVGIGTNSPQYTTQITLTSANAVTNILALHNGSNASGTGTGARLLFKLANFESSAETRKYASIEGVSVSSFNEDIDLVFRTKSSNADPAERVRIGYDGQTRFQSSVILTNGQINSLGSGGGGQPMYLNFIGNGAIYAGSSYAVLYAGSDERIKSDIEDANPTLNKILNLTPRTFKYKERPEFTNYGFIAQEVEEIMPELVKTTEGITMCDGEEIVNQKSIESYGLAWASILVKAIQELKAELDTAKTEINELKNK